MYTGKDIDSETGLTYHWNRWRSEDGSSFISEDPARDGSNWYGYCGNNPINFSDPTGLNPVTGAIVGALTGAAVDFVQQTTLNMISGQSLSEAVNNVDMKSIKYAAISGGITGAITQGLSSIKAVKKTIDLYKKAKIIVNASANMAGTTVSTMIENSENDKPLTENLGLKVAVSGTIGIASGALSKTGGLVIERNPLTGNFVSKVVYLEDLAENGAVTVLTTVAPNEIVKETTVILAETMVDVLVKPDNGETEDEIN